MEKKDSSSFIGWLTATLSLISSGVVKSLSSPQIQNLLVNFLEQEAVKFALKKLAIAGGFKAWLITFVVGELVEEGDEHLIEPAFRAVGYQEDKVDGAKVFRKVNNAQSVNQWVDSLDDV